VERPLTLLSPTFSKLIINFVFVCVQVRLPVKAVRTDFLYCYVYWHGKRGSASLPTAFLYCIYVAPGSVTHSSTYCDEIVVGSLRAPHLLVSLRCLRTFLLLDMPLFVFFYIQWYGFQFIVITFDSTAVFQFIRSCDHRSIPAARCSSSRNVHASSSCTPSATCVDSWRSCSLPITSCFDCSRSCS